MASRRAIQRLSLLRQASRAGSPLPSIASRTRSTAVGPSDRSRAAPVRWRQSQQSTRYSSSPTSPPPTPSPKPYTFEEISSLLPHAKTPPPHLIDVREPSEYASGHIPSAKNLPITSHPDGLFLPADEFLSRFGWLKPPKDQEVVFYCRAGVRSAAVARLALRAGWEKVGEYKGSWLEWEKKGGEKKT